MEAITNTETTLKQTCDKCMFFHPSGNPDNRFGLCVFQCRITFSRYGSPKCGYQPRIGESVTMDKLRELLSLTPNNNTNNGTDVCNGGGDDTAGESNHEGR